MYCSKISFQNSPMILVILIGAAWSNVT